MFPILLCIVNLFLFFLFIVSWFKSDNNIFQVSTIEREFMDLVFEPHLMTLLTCHSVCPIIIVRQFFGIAQRFHHGIVDIQLAICSLVGKEVKHFCQPAIVFFESSGIFLKIIVEEHVYFRNLILSDVFQCFISLLKKDVFENRNCVNS